MSGAYPGAITPDRVTKIVLNPSVPVVVETVLAFQRSASEMARGAGSSTSGLWLRPGSGWQLEPLQRRAYLLQESADLAAAVMGPAQISTPSGWTQSSFFAQLSAPGIAYSSSVPATGDEFWAKGVKAGDNWDTDTYRLSADQSSYPSPTLGAEDATMDRVAVGNSALTADQALFVRFSTPGAKTTLADRLITVYFCGPPGFTNQGIGQYALSFGGDGWASLYERQTSGNWTLAARLQYAAARHAHAAAHFVHIDPSTATLNPGLAGTLVFEFGLADGPVPGSSSPGQYALPSQTLRTALLNVPARAEATFQPAPFRIDARRDLRPIWQASLATYLTSATLIDDVFSFPFFPSNSQPVTLAWFSTSPTMTVGSLCDGFTGAALTVSGAIGPYPQFVLSPPQRAFLAQFQFSGDGTSTPTFFGFRVQRDGVEAETGSTPIDASAAATHFRATGPDFDPSHEKATVELEDLTGAFPTLLDQGELDVFVSTSYDPADPTLQAGLFFGQCDRPEATQKGVPAATYPSPNWRNIRLDAVGPWAKLARATSSIRFDFSLDFNSIDSMGKPTPFKASDVLKTLFAVAGFGSSMVDVPDDPYRLFPTSDPNGWILEPEASLVDLIARIAREAWGAFPLFDPSDGGVVGRWRLVPIKRAATPIASFSSAATPGKVLRISSAGPIPNGFIAKGSMRIFSKPPAYNAVCVYGGALAGLGGLQPALLKQVAINVASWSYGGAPTPPISLDSLPDCRLAQIFCPSASTQAAVDWQCRRAYDELCHGYRYRSWQGPLLLVLDAVTGATRPLRVGDRVSVDGIDHQLRSCSPDYARDAYQMAHYEGAEIV